MTESFADAGELGLPEPLARSARELLPVFYEEVRRLARRERNAVRAGQTLQTTALIHEAYLKMGQSGGFADQAHFLRAAAQAMRHALINYARERMAQKRGSGAPVLPLDAADDVGGASDEQLIEVNEALLRLGTVSPRLAQIVECRFFAGYGDQETARALGLTDRTVRRDWVKARAWLRQELAGDGAVPE